MSTPGVQIYRECDKASMALTSEKRWAGEKGPPLTNADKIELRRIFRRHKQCTDRLGRIWRDGSKAKFEHTRAQYLGAFTTRACASVRALAKTRRRVTLHDIYAFAGRLDVWKPLKERVRVKLQPKSKGGYRQITRDGPGRMAQRFILRDLLTAAGVDNESDYARPGAGGEKAMIRDVSGRIENGYGERQTADIQNCFASLKPGHLGWLPVPEKLLRKVVFLPGCAKVGIRVRLDVLKDLASELMGVAKEGSPIPYMAAIESARKKVRRGLPQGSVLSPLVARAFVGRELRAALGNKEVARFSFVDDLILGARSRPQVEQALDALRGRLLGHPAGPILLHVKPPTSTKSGRVLVFNYVLEPGRGYGGNFVHAYPGLVRFDRFHKKTYDRWKSADQPGDVDTLEQFILGRLKHWMPSQQAWTVVPVFSSNCALTSAFVYVCEQEMKEFQETSCP